MSGSWMSGAGLSRAEVVTLETSHWEYGCCGEVLKLSTTSQHEVNKGNGEGTEMLRPRNGQDPAARVRLNGGNVEVVRLLGGDRVPPEPAVHVGVQVGLQLQRTAARAVQLVLV